MSLICLEYMCPEHGRFESFEDRATAPDFKPCPVDVVDDLGEYVCNTPSPWCISAPLFKPQYGAVSQGKVADAPAPLAMDTRPLAEGMPLAEWKKRRAKLWRAEDGRRRGREKKVIVG